MFCDDETPKKKRHDAAAEKERRICTELNTFWYTMLPRVLRAHENACVKTPGCTFVGIDDGPGVCLTIGDAQAVESATQAVYNQLEESEADVPPELLMQRAMTAVLEELGGKEGKNPVTLLMGEVVGKAAARKFRTTEAYRLGNDAAREMVIQVLNEYTSQKGAGRLIKDILSQESVRSPTRWLVYSSLHTPHVYDSVQWLGRSQRDYWLRDDAKAYTTRRLSDLVSWWMLEDWTKHKVVVPLVVQTVQDEVRVRQPLSGVMERYLATEEMRQTASGALVWFLEETLKDSATQEQVNLNLTLALTLNLNLNLNLTPIKQVKGAALTWLLATGRAKIKDIGTAEGGRGSGEGRKEQSFR